MKKTIILTSVLTASLLSSCQNITSSETPTSEPSLSVLDSSSESMPSEESNSSEVTLTKDDNIVKTNNIDLSVNESYDLSVMINEQYKNKKIDIKSENDNIAAVSGGRLYGTDFGNVKVKVVVDETYYDEIDVNVKDETYMHKNFTTDLGRLFGCSFTVLGDSISDVSVTAYPSNRPDFWCEQLVEKADMTMYNHAKSGSTAGYCEAQINNPATSFAIDITGTHVVRQQLVKDSIKKSQYVFLYFGNNDVTFGTEIGKVGEVTADNCRSKESFKGAYSDIISNIRAYNPMARIVCLGLSPSTWGTGTKVNGKNQADSRAALSLVVGEIADEMGCKFIELHDVWNEASATDMQTYCPDGIHPVTAGYDLIVDRILNS